MEFTLSKIFMYIILEANISCWLPNTVINLSSTLSELFYNTKHKKVFQRIKQIQNIIKRDFVSFYFYLLIMGKAK